MFSYRSIVIFIMVLGLGVGLFVCLYDGFGSQAADLPEGCAETHLTHTATQGKLMSVNFTAIQGELLNEGLIQFESFNGTYSTKDTGLRGWGYSYGDDSGACIDEDVCCNVHDPHGNHYYRMLRPYDGSDDCFGNVTETPLDYSEFDEDTTFTAESDGAQFSFRWASTPLIIPDPCSFWSLGAFEYMTGFEATQ